MAKFIKRKAKKSRYVLELTRSEIVLIGDAFGDMAEKRAHMVYTDESSTVKPAKKSLRKMKSISEAIDAANPWSVTDDYFDRWESVNEAD